MNFGMQGIVAGALAGGANAVQGMAQSDIDAQHRSDLAAQTAQIDIDRAKAIEDYRVQSGNAQRSKMAGEINDRTGLIGRQMQADRLHKFDLQHGDGSIASRDPATLSDAAMADAPLSESDISGNRQKAATELGYITPEQDAQNNSKLLGIQATSQRTSDRLDSMERMGADRNAAMAERAQAQIDAALERAGMKAGSSGSHEKLVSIANTANGTLAALMNESHGNTPEAKADWQMRHDQAVMLSKIAVAKLTEYMGDGTAPPGAASSVKRSTAPAKASSGNSRKDVEEAYKLFTR